MAKMGRLLAMLGRHPERPTEHGLLEERERRVQACVRAVPLYALDQSVGEQHRVAEGLVRPLRLERRHRVRRVANQGDPPLRCWRGSCGGLRRYNASRS